MRAIKVILYKAIKLRRVQADNSARSICGENRQMIICLFVEELTYRNTIIYEGEFEIHLRLSRPPWIRAFPGPANENDKQALTRPGGDLKTFFYHYKYSL